MPADLLEEAADQRPAHAFLDRLAAADAGGHLPIGVEADQFAATKYRLRLLGGAGDQVLHQHFVGEAAA